MPGVTVYINDETYIKYLLKKEELNKKIVDFINKEVNQHEVQHKI